MKKLLSFLIFAVTMANAQTPASPTILTNIKLVSPLVGSKADSVMVWKGSDKILRWIPRSTFLAGIDTNWALSSGNITNTNSGDVNMKLQSGKKVRVQNSGGTTKISFDENGKVSASTVETKDITFTNTLTEENTPVKVLAKGSGGAVVEKTVASFATDLSSYFVPIAGTNVGHPITGDLEFADDRSLKYVLPGDSFGNIGFSSDATAYMKYEDNSGNNTNVTITSGTIDLNTSGLYQSQLRANRSVLTWHSDDPASKGIEGVEDFSSNIDGLSYVQKNYVDSAISTAMGDFVPTSGTTSGHPITGTLVHVGNTDGTFQEYQNLSEAVVARISMRGDGYGNLETFTSDGLRTSRITPLAVFTELGSWEWPSTGTQFASTTDVADLLTTSITDGDTTHAPDGNSVHDALVLKMDTSGSQNLVTSGDVSGTNLHASNDLTVGNNLTVSADASVKSLSITGTAGGGFVYLKPQSSNPATPATGVNVYARSTGAFSWKGTNGFQRSFIGTGITADRDYTLPDATGILVLNDNTATLTNKTWNGVAIGTGYGGTGLTALGSALQSIRVNSGGTALEYYTPSGGGGTVTALSVASANGFAGSSSGGATPIVTISTTATGILKGNGTALSAATAGTDYVIPSGSITGNAATATALQTSRTIGTITGDATSAGSSFDGTANNTNALTLSTVNGNVGSFGSATQSGTFTVNGKGLITAAGNTTITPAIGSITGLGAGIATWLATPSSANLASAATDETGAGALVFGTSPMFTTSFSLSSNGSFTNATTSNRFNLNVGSSTASATASRNLADSVDAFAIDNSNASSTGAICSFKAAGTTVASVQRSGKITAVAGTASTDVVVLSQLTGALKAGSYSSVGTATTTFTVTIGVTEANTSYKVNVTPTDALAAGLFYVNNKTTTTFDVVYLSGLTGTVSFDFAVFP